MICSRLLKQSASLSDSFDLFGLSCLSRSYGLFGLSGSLVRGTKYTRQTRQINETRQTRLVPDVQAIEVLLCRNGYPVAY